MAIDIVLDKGITLDMDQQKKALKAVGKEFIRECRQVLNDPANTDMPHTDTGALARSLKLSVRSRKGSIWVKIGANTRYATALFAGSDRGHGIHVKGRPLFDYVLERMKPKMNQIIQKSIQVLPVQ